MRLRILIALASTNQMYSGVGRALRELTARLARSWSVELAVDDLAPRNVGLLREFAAEHGLPLHVGRHRQEPDAPDPANADLPALLAENRFDAIELVGWANAATHRQVLAQAGDITIVYTPHDQPLRTVPLAPDQAATVADTHARLLRRADLVLADSPAEASRLARLTGGRPSCRFLPLGCDFDDFRPGPDRRDERLLFVGDLNEVRKRFDRVLAAFASLASRRPGVRLTVVGNRSDDAIGLVPEALRTRVDLRGYVTEAELRRAYAESAGLVLLSDCEAFGLPIVEALACGTPVFLSRLPETEGLFGGFAGARFCPADDPEGTAAAIAAALDRGPGLIRAVLDDRDRLRAAFGWDHLAARKREAVEAAWAWRSGWSWSA